MGNEHSQAYRRIPETWPDAEFEPVLVHVADNVLRVAETSARRWGYVRSSTDWRAVVDDPDVHVVDITGPNAIHREVALAAAAAGKHVGCEKPLGRTAGEAAEIAAAVAEAGVHSNCNFQYRHNPAVQYVHQLLTAGKLGTLTHLRGVFLTDFGWSPEAPFAWRFDGQVAGWGALGDIGSHTIDMLELLAGPVEEVVGTTATFVAEHDQQPVTNEDYAAAVLRFAGGALGTFEVSRASAGPKDAFRVGGHGTRGAFDWDSERMNEIQVFETSGDEAADGYRRLVMGPSHPWYGRLCPGAGSGLAWHDMTVISMYQFLRGIVEEQPTPTDFRRASHVAAVLDAIQSSHATHGWTPVAPVGF
jgi:predicted dehydrogenase